MLGQPLSYRYFVGHTTLFLINTTQIELTEIVFQKFLRILPTINKITNTMKIKQILLALGTIFCMNAMAQDFEVSPLKLSFTAEPGESQTKFITLKNHSGKTETFMFKLNDMNIDANGSIQYLESGSLRYSVADWISIAPSFFELGPQEEKQVAVTMQQPTNEFGSKWGILFVYTAQEQTAFDADKSVHAGVNVSARIAITVTQTPGSNKNYRATISNLSETTADNQTTRTFSAMVNNLTELITECHVSMIATNLETEEEIVIDPITFQLYPRASRRVQLEFNKPLKKGRYSLAAILDYGTRGSQNNLEGTQIIISAE